MLVPLLVFTGSIVMAINRGPGEGWNMPFVQAIITPDGTASHPPLSSTVFSSLKLVYSKLLMLVAGADETARLPHSLSLSLSFPTQLSKHNTTFPPSKKVHERSLNYEQKNNSPHPQGHRPMGSIVHTETIQNLHCFLGPCDMACVCKLAANSIWQTHLIW